MRYDLFSISISVGVADFFGFEAAMASSLAINKDIVYKLFKDV
jgi:hypothetical protein